MARPKVLVADDDRDFLNALSMRLTIAGYEVAQAPDGAAAIELAKHAPPDLLILDVHMPAGDGFVCVKELDRHPSLQMLPVIYITGDRTNATSCNAEKHGALAVLHKPIDWHDLLEMIHLLIGPAQASEHQSDDHGLRDVA